MLFSMTPVPGTTRDVIETTIHIEGIPLRLMDTAGFRPVEGTVEKMGIQLTEQKLGEADLSLAVIDQSRPLNRDDHRILSKVQRDKTLLVINTEFHDLLYALSKSPRLIHMINGLRDQIYRFRELILKDQKHAGTSHEDHLQMLKFMRNRDAERVEKLVREHILRGQEALLTDFGKEITNNG